MAEQICKWCKSTIFNAGNEWADHSGIHELKCMLSPNSRHEPVHEPVAPEAEPRCIYGHSLSEHVRLGVCPGPEVPPAEPPAVPAAQEAVSFFAKEPLGNGGHKYKRCFVPAIRTGCGTCYESGRGLRSEFDPIHAQPSPQPAGAEQDNEAMFALGFFPSFTCGGGVTHQASEVPMNKCWYCELAALRKSHRECVGLLRKYGPQHGMPEDVETALANAAKLEGK